MLSGASGNGASLSGHRIACLMVKDFAQAAQIRANPELREAAFAICIGKGARAPLGFVASPARRAGITTGMTVAQARAALPELTIIPRSPGLERAAADALIDAAESLSPIAEEAAPGRVYLDLAGLGRLYGTEEEMARELLRRTWQIGLEAAVGIAASREVANLAAACGGMRIIAPGREVEFLQWLPLELIELDPELEMRLERLGIRRLGDLARMDTREIGSRLGSGALALARLMDGGGGLPLRARSAAENFVEGMELDYAIESLEPMAFVLRAMLERLVARLKLRGLVAGDATLSLRMADYRCDDRRVQIAAATNEVRSLLALILLDLEKAPPAAGVEEIVLSLQARPPRQAQSDLFLPPAPAPERLQTVIARIAALCGPERIGTLLPADSHRPGAFIHAPFAPSPPRPAPRETGGEPGAAVRLVLRALRPPREVEILFTCDRPEFVRGEQIGARVVSIAGPWRREGEWWKSAADGADPQAAPEGGFARDYYQMALSDGGIYRVFCDRTSARWFVDGIYD